MTMLKPVIFVAITAFAALLSMNDAKAVTIGFDGISADPYIEDGFMFVPNRIVNGNCLDNPCAALNNNETMVMSLVGGGLFDLTSINFNLLGNGTGNTLFIDADTGAMASFSVPAFAKNTYHFIDFAGAFNDVMSVTFRASDGGNVRLDEFIASPVVVPLPATLPLLLGALGGFAYIGRRRRS